MATISKPLERAFCAVCERVFFIGNRSLYCSPRCGRVASAHKKRLTRVLEGHEGRKKERERGRARALAKALATKALREETRKRMMENRAEVTLPTPTPGK